jgi:hypothetical protein
MNKITTLALVIGLTVVAAPLIASAQCIEVTPESWDYGDVKIGTAKSQIFTIHSCDEASPVLVSTIEITDDDTGAFSITSGPAVPLFIPAGESIEVEVTFTPPELGAHEAFLHIRHDAAGGHTYVNLSGAGVRGWRCFEAKIEP